MVNQTSNKQRLEILLETRSRTLKEAKTLVEAVITKVTQGLQESHGIQVFQTMHILDCLEHLKEWQALGIGHHSLVNLIRDCGFENVHWKTPSPCSRLLKVWRRKQDPTEPRVNRGGKK